MVLWRKDQFQNGCLSDFDNVSFYLFNVMLTTVRFFFRVFTGDRVFDVIAGAVADDRTVAVINQYMNGLKIPVRILTA